MINLSKKGKKDGRKSIQRRRKISKSNAHVVINNTSVGGGRFSEPSDEKIHYLENIVGKQLDLYNWCEEKVSTLATLDSILLAAATLFIDKMDFFEAGDSIQVRLLNTGIIILILLPLFISLAIALWHIRPKMGRASNKGRPNHRSSNGIRHFSDKAAYSNHLRNITAEEICEDLSNQIYGMNYNIWVNQKSIKRAVLFDLISLAGFFAVIVYYGIFK